MQEQQTQRNKPKMMWLFDKNRTAFEYLWLRQCYNFTECWYESEDGKLYDPWYVHSNRAILKDKIWRDMYVDYTNQKEILLVFTQKILKRYY